MRALGIETTGRTGEARPPARPLLPPARTWAAIHTRPRAEKVVEADLRRRGVPVFLPVARRRRRYGSRVRESWIPLFPGYLFYDFDAIPRLRVFDSRRVANVLVPKDAEELQRDLENLARALAGSPDLRRVEDLTPGTPIRVVSGPFQGTVGEVVRAGTGFHLVLRVHFLGFGAEMEVDESCLERLA